MTIPHGDTVPARGLSPATKGRQDAVNQVYHRGQLAIEARAERLSGQARMDYDRKVAREKERKRKESARRQEECRVARKREKQRLKDATWSRPASFRTDPFSGIHDLFRHPSTPVWIYRPQGHDYASNFFRKPVVLSPLTEQIMRAVESVLPGSKKFGGVRPHDALKIYAHITSTKWTQIFNATGWWPAGLPLPCAIGSYFLCLPGEFDELLTMLTEFFLWVSRMREIPAWCAALDAHISRLPPA